MHVYVYDLTRTQFQQKGPQTMIQLTYSNLTQVILKTAFIAIILNVWLFKIILNLS
jgi:hypothetical protein